jgi:hypothetical protein
VRLLVFGVSTLLWLPPTLKTSMTARLWGFYLSLSTTTPENEHDCSFSGFLSFSGHHQPRKQARLLVFGVSTFLWPPPAPKKSRTAHLRGFYLSLATTSPEKEQDCSSSGFLPFSGHHHPRKRARLLVFGVSTFLWPPSAPKTGMTARLRGLDLSLASTTPEKEHNCSFLGVWTFLWLPPALKSCENEHDCSSSGFGPFSDSHRPQQRAYLFVSGFRLFSDSHHPRKRARHAHCSFLFNLIILNQILLHSW